MPPERPDRVADRLLGFSGKTGWKVSRLLTDPGPAQAQALTPTEFQIPAALLSGRRTAVTREALLRKIGTATEIILMTIHLQCI